MLTEHFVFYLASLQERQQLSRELHDYLAPGLGTIKIQTSLITRALDQGELDQARQQLQELKELANDLYFILMSDMTRNLKDTDVRPGA